jgi:hypothetical protein
LRNEAAEEVKTSLPFNAVALKAMRCKVLETKSRSSLTGFFYSLSLFFHRAAAAFFAISDRFLADSFAARALPPFLPPSLPNATAAGFFSFGLFASTASGSKISSRDSIIENAASFGSDLVVLERLRIHKVYHRREGLAISKAGFADFSNTRIAHYPLPAISPARGCRRRR